MKTKLILFSILLALLSGCGDQVNSSKLIGVWECIDAWDADAVGARYTFYKDGRLLQQDSLGLSKRFVKYEIRKDNLYTYSIKDGSLIFSDPVSLKSGILSVGIKNSTEDWIHFKKVSEI